MLCLKSASKMCIRQLGYKNRGLRGIFSECTRLRKERCLPHTLCRTIISSVLTKSSSLSCLKSGNHTSCRCIMEQASAIKSDRQPKSCFQQLMHSRKKQAQRSVLLEVPKKEDVPYAIALCESFGSIANAYSYDGESNNCFILLEFTDESIVRNLFLNCQCKNTSDAFPISSRVIRFEKKQQTNLPKVNIAILEDNKEKSPVNNGSSISGLIEDMFATEKLSEFSIRMRYFFCILVKDSLSGLFPYCDVLPFGSSVNGIGRQGCDLDVMLRLYPEEGHSDSELYFLNKTCVGDVKALQQKTISCIGDIMRTFFPGISNVQKILHARMPIIKLHHRLLKMHCDISINNVSAVLMSEIVHFCGEIDFRVRPLLHAVKIWAKESNVTYDNPGTWITNFGLTTLVLYFLQNRPNPILPSFNDAVVIVGEDTSPGFRIQYLKSLDELKACASVNEESLASLLKEFLIFLGTYSFKECIISLMSGKSIPRTDGTPIWVQYPFEEDLNVTKNVSDFEFYDMCEKASTAAQNLENSINQNVHFKDIGAALGIQLKRQDSSKSKKNSKRIDVSDFLDEPPKGARQKTVRHRVL